MEQRSSTFDDKKALHEEEDGEKKEENEDWFSDLMLQYSNEDVLFVRANCKALLENLLILCALGGLLRCILLD